MVHWMEYGAQREKIVMGCGFYGKAMILQDPSNNGLMAPVKTANAPGPYTDNIGTLGYNEVEMNKTIINFTEFDIIFHNRCFSFVLNSSNRNF